MRSCVWVLLLCTGRDSLILETSIYKSMYSILNLSLSYRAHDSGMYDNGGQVEEKDAL